MTSSRYVLCVDDEPLLLEGLERTLRDAFEIVTETKPLAALALLEKGTYDFAAIISDMRMPVIDGAKFLSCAAELAPDATRLLLTGNADVNAAIAAVNTGRIFRFLCKPCPPVDLVTAVEAAAEQHRLRRAEKELLEDTLTGTVRLLSEVLGLVAPRVFAHNQRVQENVVFLARRLGRTDTWRFELAACLHMIGCVGLPEETFNRALAGTPLSEEEALAFGEHPLMSHRLLKKIPRFEDIAEMLRLQADSDPAEAAPDVELGARMLRVSRWVEQLVSQGLEESQAIAQMMPATSPAEQELLQLLAERRPREELGELKQLRVGQMTAQMVLAEDVKTKTGVVVVPSQKQLTSVLLERLMRFARAGVLVEPVRVRVPA